MGRDVPEDETEDDYFDSGNERDREDAHPPAGKNQCTAHSSQEIPPWTT